MPTHQTPPTPTAPALKAAVSLIITAWFASVFWLAADGAFTGPPGKPPLPIFIGFALPLITFFAALRFSTIFRQFALSLDLRVIAAAQGWRVLGFAFLALYAHGILPGTFAWPAGIGDMIVGFSAPWIVSRLIQQPDFAATRTFLAWNLFGILDLLDAVATGAALSALAGPGQLTTSSMAQLPMVLIPAFLVPMMLMLHVVALLKTREGRVARRRHMQLAAA